MRRPRRDTRSASALLAGVLIGAIGLGGAGCSSSPPPAKPRMPRLVSSVWSPEALGLCAQLDVGPAWSAGDGLVGEAQYRLSGPGLPNEVYATPTERGAVCFTLAETPAEMSRVRPGTLTVEALVGGDLTELGTVVLDEASIARLFEAALERSRLAEGEPGPGGSVEIEYRVEPQPAPAGGFVSLHAEARSTGTRPVYQLKVLLQPLEGSELEPTVFDFGMLQPGETLALEQRVSIPRTARREAAEFGVMATEKHAAAIESVDAVRVAIEPLPIPALTSTLSIESGGSEGESGMPVFRPGDDVHLVCTVRNFGEAPLKGAVARLVTPSPDMISVRTGRALVGDLPPTATGRAHFWLVVTAPLGSAPVPVVVEIEDADLGVVSETAMLLHVRAGANPNVGASR